MIRKSKKPSSFLKKYKGLTSAKTARKSKPKGRSLKPIKKIKFLPPYQKNGKTTFPESQNKSGTYLIKEKGKIVYVGFSRTNIYKTMYRHFQSWNHKTQEVVTYNNKPIKDYLVRLVFCTPKQASSLEMKLITKYNPRDNTNKYIDFKPTAYDNKIFDEYRHSEECPF